MTDALTLAEQAFFNANGFYGSLADVQMSYYANASPTLNVANYASLSAAIDAAPDGALLLLPARTYSAAVLVNVGKTLTFRGDGNRSTIIDAGASTYGINVPTTVTSLSRLTFENIGFIGSTSSIVLLSRAVTKSATFIGCRFSGFTVGAIQTFGVDLDCIRCEFTSNGTSGTTTAIQHYRGAQRIKIRDSVFRFLNRGFYCTDTDGPATDVDVSGCLFDGGWQYLKSIASNSGGTVTYAATTVTDSAATFGSLTVSSTVRALAAKRTGTITSISSTKVTDSGANFTTASVLKGDIVRTSTLWAVVDEVVSTTVLKVEEWLNLSDYDYAPAPATTTAYTVYGLVLGKVVSNTSTAITVDAWRDWNGTIATPASSTLYEVAPLSDYQCYIYRADKVRVTDNTLRRSWADGISAQLCRNLVISNNNVYDTQDVGITVGQPSGVTQGPEVVNNRLTHVGSAGIWAGNLSDFVIALNSIEDANWMSISGATYGGITLDNCTHGDVSHNTVIKINHPQALKAIHSLNGSTDIDFIKNKTRGFSVQDFMFTGSSTTNMRGFFQPDTKFTLVSSAPPARGEFSGAGSPEGVLVGAVGSIYRRTDGGNITTLYVKGNGTGNTGWTVPTTVSDLPTAAIAQAFTRRTTMATQTPTSARLTMAAIYLTAGDTITSISFTSSTTALSGGTHGWAALYDGSLNLLRQSTDDTAPTWAASAIKTFTLSSTYPIVTTGWYYIGFCIVATTMPTVTAITPATIMQTAAQAIGGWSTASLTGTAPDPAGALAAAWIPYGYVS